MRNLQKTLQSFEANIDMAYSADFDSVKAVLEYCHKHIKPFDRLHFRSGNEAFINELSNRMQNLFVEAQLTDNETHAPLPAAKTRLRSILMFLLVNTDATYKYNLREDTTLTHVVELCPLMPKFLFVALVWELQLDQYFYELLSYSPTWLSFQYFEVAADSLKYIDDPYDVLEKVEQLLRAILISMTRSRLSLTHVVDQKIMYGKLHAYAMNLLRQFYTPDAEKFQHFRKKQLFRYSGFALKHLLQLVLFGFDTYECPEKSVPAIDTDIYNVHPQSDSRPPPAEKKPLLRLELFKEEQLKIIAVLLNSLQYNVMLVRIEVFIYWVEVDIDQSNLQMIVGEMAHAVGERIAANKQFSHDVQTHLKMISIQPKTLEEIIDAASLGDILLNLDKPNMEAAEKMAWLSGLFGRMAALGNAECLQTLRGHVKLMTPEHCRKILEYMKLTVDYDRAENNLASEKETYMEVDSEEFEQLRWLLHTAMRNFNVNDLLHLLATQADLFGLNSKICCNSWPEYTQRVTEFFNKSTSGVDLLEFLLLCFESPLYFWMKFLNTACESPQNVSTFCETLQRTQAYSNLYMRPLLDDALHNETQLQNRHFPELLAGIYFAMYGVEQRPDFMKQFINENVNNWLESHNFDALLPIVRALNLISSRGDTQSHKSLNFGTMTAPVLVMVAKIMDKCRWDLITYTHERDEIVQECIQFVQQNSRKFLPVATEKDRSWIRKLVKESFRPLTQFYFQKYSLTPDQAPLELDRFLLRNVGEEDVSQLETFLISHYVRCTMKETEWLARSARLTPLISDTMLILSGIVVETNTPNSLSNYNNCLVNYANIVKKFLLPAAQHDETKSLQLLLKLLEIIKCAPPVIYENVFINYEGILTEVLASNRSMSAKALAEVESALAGLPDCQGKVMFAEKLAALNKS